MRATKSGTKTTSSHWQASISAHSGAWRSRDFTAAANAKWPAITAAARTGGGRASPPARRGAAAPARTTSLPPRPHAVPNEVRQRRQLLEVRIFLALARDAGDRHVAVVVTGVQLHLARKLRDAL